MVFEPVVLGVDISSPPRRSVQLSSPDKRDYFEGNLNSSELLKGPPGQVQPASISSETEHRRCSSTGGSSRAQALAALAQKRDARKVSARPGHVAPEVLSHEYNPAHQYIYSGGDPHQDDMGPTEILSNGVPPLKGEFNNLSVFIFYMCLVIVVSEYFPVLMYARPNKYERGGLHVNSGTESPSCLGCCGGGPQTFACNCR